MKNEKETVEMEVSEVPGAGLQETQLTTTARPPMGQVFDLTSSTVPLPDLGLAEEIPLDLVSDYWTPENAGEFKNVFFVGIDNSPVLDQNTGETIDLECGFFLEKDSKGQVKQIRNGSKRLVGAMVANGVQRGTALKITFMGKKKNRTNSYLSDSWSIKPLRVNLEVTE